MLDSWNNIYIYQPHLSVKVQKYMYYFAFVMVSVGKLKVCNFANQSIFLNQHSNYPIRYQGWCSVWLWDKFRSQRSTQGLQYVCLKGMFFWHKIQERIPLGKITLTEWLRGCFGLLYKPLQSESQPVLSVTVQMPNGISFSLYKAE